MPSHCNPHLCSDRLKHLLLPCFSFRFTSYSTSNTMLSARSALTPSAATEHDNELLLQHTATSSTARIPEAATEHSEIQRITNFLADSARTSLDLPYMTLAQRRLAEQIVADDQTLQCERCDFGQERWLHIFKQSSRGRWYGSRPPGMPSMVPAYSRAILPTPNWKKTYSANRSAEKESEADVGHGAEMQSGGSSSTAGIPEAATEHSEIQRLLAFANTNTPASKAACQEAKRPRKSGKGTESKRPKKSGKGTRLHARKTSSDSPMSSDTETQVPTVLPSDDELPTPTDVPSDDQQALAPAPSPGG